ncbi:MAG TPA: single-stranded DNA-binding protein [Acidimicrobiales bacterium]|nr:single-stranded DNA-binding protein [Acidimicrobiales bacterium]
MSTKKATDTTSTTVPNTLSSVNQVILVGRLTADPELRTTSAGPVARLRVATNDTTPAEFHDIVLWGDDAEHIVRTFGKGSPVRVTGRLRTRDWTGRDGGARRTTEIVAESVDAYVRHA